MTGQSQSMDDICVIFDLDGTLVDSELLCNQAFVDLLPDLTVSAEILLREYRGRKLSCIFRDLEERIGRPLGEDFERVYRHRVAELFGTDLKPVRGVRKTLERLDRPKCVASSGPRSKIELAMRISGLATFFGSNVFSSYEIKSWKPEPGLFLHAAAAMGFSPNNCVVVEDSAVGIEAALAAGMTAVHFCPTSETRVGNATLVIEEMAQLPELIEGFAKARYNV
ncbi:HAD-IA family hydrolase [Roseibium sediminis]|uniref:HAD-IA family hydrolase n=1 Tax=Roseibium sediminis TaxID=1775174 RepID=UPI00195F1401|nr:HAD-IA family hydrolase [Roseibium sediminis]